MKKDNLERMAAHIETVPPEMFNIIDWRLNRTNEVMSFIECNSVGCVIGHCVQLDSYPELIPRIGGEDGDWIDFPRWSFQFTGLLTTNKEWRWMFAPEWVEVDNTPTGAARRIRHFLTNGLPSNWEEQMNGEEPITY